MPRLTDLNANLETQKLPTGNFSFSHTRLDDLGATRYTLVDLTIDISGSTAGFRDEMEKCLKEVVRSCKYSPASDNLMIRLIIFAQRVKEIHGYKLLSNINESDYDGILQKDHNIGGTTALFDASINSVEAQTKFGSSLGQQDYDRNGIFVCITDGENNEGVFTARMVGQKLKEAVSSEALESLLSILVGININNPTCKAALDSFVKEAEFSQYVDAGQANAQTLAKLAKFISKSISSQSSALTTGGPSKTLTF